MLMADLPDLNLRQKVQPLLEAGGLKKILFLIVLAALFAIFTDVILISVLVVLSIFAPLALKRLGLKMIGIELVTLTTVLVALTMGAEAGALAGFFLMTGHMVSGQYSGAYLVWVIPGYAAAGFLAGTLNMPITTLGIGLAVGLNAVFTFLTAGITPEALPYFIPHAVGNVLFNAALFIYLAPQLLSFI